MTSLPESLFDLSDLEELDVTCNQTAGIPIGISGMVKLRDRGFGSRMCGTMTSRFNCIKEIPVAITELGALEFLGLSGNESATFPDEIGNLRNRRTLVLFTDDGDRQQNNPICDNPPELARLRALIPWSARS